MNKLKLIENMGLKVSWELIYIGLYERDEITNPILTYPEVFDYLDSLLTSVDQHTDNIIALICEGDNAENIKKKLKNLSKNDNTFTHSIQLRKWRACLLKILLDQITDQDYFQGLLEILEFWEFNFIVKNLRSKVLLKNEVLPIPPSSETINVQEFFTQVNYKSLILKNQKWLNQEIQSIIESEKELQGLSK